MVPIVAVVGPTNSGKTTLIEKLIPALSARGYHLATIKHHHHGDFDADHPGKDSWRHARAGAIATAFAGTRRLAVFQQADTEELSQREREAKSVERRDEVEPVERSHVRLAVEEDREVLPGQEMLVHERNRRVITGERAVEHRQDARNGSEGQQSADRRPAACGPVGRLGEIGRGRLVGPSEERLTFEDLASDYLQDQALKGTRSSRWARERVAHLRGFFGTDRALDISTDRIRTYIQSRLQEEAAAGTVNRDLAALSRMFSLAIEAGRLTARPHIPRLQEAQPRQGFMEHGEYLAIRTHLPADYQDALDFGYHSGWRRGEIFRLEWRDVDRQAGVVRLRPELSKNRDGRVLILSPPLAQLIERRWRGRALGCQFVFHVKGKPIGEWRKTWTRACQAAGLPGRLFHDLRRTVVRNLVRAGVTERVAMTMTGHKTRSVFDRYNIVNEGDLRQAATRHADYVAQQAPGPTVVPLPGIARP